MVVSSGHYSTLDPPWLAHGKSLVAMAMLAGAPDRGAAGRCNLHTTKIYYSTSFGTKCHKYFDPALKASSSSDNFLVLQSDYVYYKIHCKYCDNHPIFAQIDVNLACHYE
jgi:hypothetical protein